MQALPQRHGQQRITRNRRRADAWRSTDTCCRSAMASAGRQLSTLYFGNVIGDPAKIALSVRRRFDARGPAGVASHRRARIQLPPEWSEHCLVAAGFGATVTARGSARRLQPTDEGWFGRRPLTRTRQSNAARLRNKVAPRSRVGSAAFPSGSPPPGADVDPRSSNV
jgi:hypothetical protein